MPPLWRGSAAASQSLLQEKVLAFVLREHPNSDYIPKPVLLQWLQHEYEVRAWQMAAVLS